MTPAPAGHAATLLVVAKAPVPGRVKTRLVPPATQHEAADIAAAALLDTLDAARRVGEVVVAVTGRLSQAVRRAAVHRSMSTCAVLPQRGDGLGERLVHAHQDAAAVVAAGPVLQIGMDTPQVTAPLLADACLSLGRRGVHAVLGLAEDGGWWALGVSHPALAGALATVPMSRSDTGARTLDALRAAGAAVRMLPTLRDVDTFADAVAVAAQCPNGRFAQAVRPVAARVARAEDFREQAS